MWNGLAEIFGGKLVREFGDEAPRLWAEAILSLSDDQLANGFKRLIDEPRPFGVNLSEFVAVCRERQMGPVRHLGVPLTQEQRAQLSGPKVNLTERGERIIAGIRSRLGLEKGI